MWKMPRSAFGKDWSKPYGVLAQVNIGTVSICCQCLPRHVLSIDDNPFRAIGSNSNGRGSSPALANLNVPGRPISATSEVNGVASSSSVYSGLDGTVRSINSSYTGSSRRNVYVTSKHSCRESYKSSYLQLVVHGVVWHYNWNSSKFTTGRASSLV